VLSAGATVWHDIFVMEARRAHEELTASIVDGLKRVVAANVMDFVDLYSVDEERGAFVSELLGYFGEKKAPIPAPALGGDLAFRQKLSKYMARYNGTRTSEDSIFVGPSRALTYQALALAITSPGDLWVVNRELHRVVAPVLGKLGIRLVVCSDSVKEAIEMLSLLRPSVMTYAVPGDGKHYAVGQYQALVRAAKAQGTTLVIDDTEDFIISSKPSAGGVLGGLAPYDEADYPIYVVGLEKSNVYPEFQVTFVVHPEPGLHRQLKHAANATYGTIGWFPQKYYDYLFDDMVSFHVDMENSASAKPAIPTPASERDITPTSELWAKHLTRSPLNTTLERIATFLGTSAEQVDALEADGLERRAAAVPGAPRELLTHLIPRLLEASPSELDASAEQEVVGFLQSNGPVQSDVALPVVICYSRVAALFDVLAAIRRRLGAADEIKVVRAAVNTTEDISTLHAVVAAGFEPMAFPGKGKSWPANPGEHPDLLLMDNVGSMEDTLSAMSSLPATKEVWMVYGDGVVEEVNFELKGKSAEARMVMYGGLDKQLRAPGLSLGWVLSPNQSFVDGLKARWRLDNAPLFLQRAVSRLVSARKEKA